ARERLLLDERGGGRVGRGQWPHAPLRAVYSREERDGGGENGRSRTRATHLGVVLHGIIRWRASGAPCYPGQRCRDAGRSSRASAAFSRTKRARWCALPPSALRSAIRARTAPG